MDSSKGQAPSLVGFAMGGWHIEFGLFAIQVNMQIVRHASGQTKGYVTMMG